MNLPLLLAVLGLVALFVASLLLRSIGRGYRIARLLAAAPEVSIAEALELAAGPERFVRVRGRVESDEEFPDEHDRPLVFRRERLETRGPGSPWRTLQEDRVAVPFGVGLRSMFIAVDVDAIASGLVVLPRESIGRAGEVAERLPADVPVDAEVRLRVEQVSAVEQASIAGVPRPGRDGQPWMTAGAGRPLIVATMELPEAMRILAGGRRRVVLAAVACIATGV
ncbi:MAG: hypothetical protein H0W07_05310, partial [Chloroflexi bacterium]|nr:hypothetical protein [Chloroflexota bacterium]